MQRGRIYRHRRSWFLQYRDVRFADGKPVVKRVAVRLAPIGKEFPSKNSVRVLADRVLAPINDKRMQPESAMPLVDFIEQFYLPMAEKHLRPSTVLDYRDIWKQHLKPRLAPLNLKVREFRTVHGQRMLASIEGVSHERLLRVRAVLSAAFTLAIRDRVLDGVNPMHAVKVPGKPKKFRGPTYTLLEIDKMLIGALDGVARVAVAVAAFTGLRLGEIRGLRWSDYDGQKIYVRRAVWRTVVGPTKTAESEGAVLVIAGLRTILDSFKKGAKDSDYIFAGERRGQPLNFHNLSARVIKPAFKSNDIPWKGWYAFRRGLASNLLSLKVDPQVIAGILRHDVATTLRFYAQVPEEDTRDAMQKIVENTWSAE